MTRRLFPRFSRLGAAVIAAFAVPIASLRAQPAEPFYKGRTISLYSGFTPGGSYDLYARMLARHLGRHLAGNPAIVVQTMPGAGGLTAANYLYVVAPRDGAAIGLLSQTLAVEEALGAPGVQYKSAAFNWIGRIAPTIEVTMTRSSANVRSIEAARTRQILLASSGPGSALDSYPRILAQAAGLNLKLVSGYKGSSEAALAMEKGEVDGTGTTWNTLKANRQDWLRDGRIDILVQYTRTRSPELPDVPAAPELGRTPEDRELLDFYMSGGDIGRAFLAPPGLPGQRIAELRAAFDAAMVDPELSADIRRANAEFAPLSGRELEKLVAATLDVKPALAARVRDILRVAK